MVTERVRRGEEDKLFLTSRDQRREHCCASPHQRRLRSGGTRNRQEGWPPRLNLRPQQLARLRPRHQNRHHRDLHHQHLPRPTNTPNHPDRQQRLSKLATSPQLASLTCNDNSAPRLLAEDVQIAFHESSWREFRASKRLLPRRRLPAIHTQSLLASNWQVEVRIQMSWRPHTSDTGARWTWFRLNHGFWWWCKRRIGEQFGEFQGRKEPPEPVLPGLECGGGRRTIHAWNGRSSLFCSRM
jgi:hypothetical protein